jgi:hypothetical protein
MSDRTWEVAMPDVDPIALKDEETILAEHARLCGFFYYHLLSHKVPEHLADTIVENWSVDVLVVPEPEEED